MDRKYSLLLNHSYPNICSYDELISFLNYSLKSSIDCMPYNSKVPSLTSLMIYVCGYASVRELQFMLGRVFESSGINTYSRLTKAGALEKFSFPCDDFGSHSAFHVTDAGFASYLSFVSDDLKEGGGVKQGKRRKAQKVIKSSKKEGEKTVVSEKTVPIVPMHDYGVGISLLSLLSLRRGISITKEASFRSGAAVSTSGKMRTDAWVNVDGDSSTHYPTRIFLEQDMGTESTRQIVNKLYAYGDTRILDSRQNCIILSCYSPGTVGGGRFESAPILRLADFVEASGFGDLFSCYEATAATPLSRSELASLLVSVGAATWDPARPGEAKRTEGAAFGAAELRAYADTLANGGNEAYEKAVNSRLVKVAKRNLYSICSYLYKVMFVGDNLTAGFFPGPVFRGYGIYVLPSTLLSNSAEFFMVTDDSDRLGRYSSSIAGYFPEIGSYMFGVRASLRLMVKANESSEPCQVIVEMPHAYCSLTGDFVCFEHLGRDVGAFIRLLALGRAVNRDELNVHVIAIVDTIEDANQLTKLIDPMPFIKGKDGNYSFTFNFLFEHTCVGDGKAPLFEFNRPFDPVRTYLDESLRFKSRPKPPNATLQEVFSYSISEFS